MLPAAHVRRARFQSVSNDNEFQRYFETQNLGSKNFEKKIENRQIDQNKRKTLAQATK